MEKLKSNNYKIKIHGSVKHLENKAIKSERMKN
jgi:hypothetical protein